MKQNTKETIHGWLYWIYNKVKLSRSKLIWTVQCIVRELRVVNSQHDWNLLLLSKWFMSSSECFHCLFGENDIYKYIAQKIKSWKEIDKINRKRQRKTNELSKKKIKRKKTNTMNVWQMIGLSWIELNCILENVK